MNTTLDALDHRRAVRWFFLLAFVVLAAGYGLRDPWPADEPRFVLVAKQMFESGEWLFPHRGHELYPDKPPLYFWLLSACYALVGSWRWSFLLPSLLAGLGTLWLTLDLGRRLWNPRAGLWAAIAVLASLQFVYQFKRAQIDPTLVLLTTLSLYGLCRHLLLGPHWRWFWAGCFAAGLGVIAKGVGFLPLLALLPFGLMKLRGWQGLADTGRGNGLRWSLGALLFLAAIALWLLPMLATALSSGNPEHTEYMNNILFKQTAERYADAWGHHKPVWFFLEVIAISWLPFSLAFAWLWRPWREAWRGRDGKVWLLLGWALLVVVLFSGSSGKRDMYILPALPAFALAAAPFLQGISERLGFRRAVLGFVLAVGLLLALAGAAALLAQPKFATSLVLERGLGDEARWLWLWLAASGLAMLALAAWLRTAGALKACAAALVLLWCGYGFIVHPVLDASSSARGLMQRARELAGPATVLGLVDWKEQNLLQAVGPVEEFGFRASEDVQLARGLRWLREQPRQRLLLAQNTAALACVDFAAGDARRVARANRRDWWLLGPDAVAGCAGDSDAREPRRP
jgi:4-amino-4-deoxy-L-arabinose transferase-like glycosyltransferase